MIHALNGLWSLFTSSPHFLLQGIKNWKSRHCSVRTVVFGSSLENVNESVIRSRSVHGKCESFAEQSRSEQMKWLQIAMTESYTWNLGTGLLHLSTHEVTKGVGGKGKKKKSSIQKEVKKIQSKFGRFDGAVKISAIKTEWTIQILLLM